MDLKSIRSSEMVGATMENTGKSYSGGENYVSHSLRSMRHAD
jgi:hypothetical protein